MDRDFFGPAPLESRKVHWPMPDLSTGCFSCSIHPSELGCTVVPGASGVALADSRNHRDVMSQCVSTAPRAIEPPPTPKTTCVHRQFFRACRCEVPKNRLFAHTIVSGCLTCPITATELRCRPETNGVSDLPNHRESAAMCPDPVRRCARVVMPAHEARSCDWIRGLLAFHGRVVGVRETAERRAAAAVNFGKRAGGGPHARERAAPERQTRSVHVRTRSNLQFGSKSLGAVGQVSGDGSVRMSTGLRAESNGELRTGKIKVGGREGSAPNGARALRRWAQCAET